MAMALIVMPAASASVRARATVKPAFSGPSPEMSMTWRRQSGTAANWASGKADGLADGGVRAVKARGMAAVAGGEAGDVGGGRASAARAATSACCADADHWTTASATWPVHQRVGHLGVSQGVRPGPAICKRYSPRVDGAGDVDGQQQAPSRRRGRDCEQAGQRQQDKKACAHGGSMPARSELATGKANDEHGGRCRFLLPGTCEPRLTRLSART